MYKIIQWNINDESLSFVLARIWEAFLLTSSEEQKLSFREELILYKVYEHKKNTVDSQTTEFG